MSAELLESARSGNLHKVQSLLSSGAKIDTQNIDRDTALHIAVLNGNKDIVDFLINRGADINIPNQHNETPLHKAVVRGNIEIIQMLLDAGVNMEIRNQQGYTPLHTAILVGRSNDVIYLLVEQGSDLSTKNQLGESLLHTAVSEGLEEVAASLIEKGLSPDLRDNVGNRPLHLVVAKKNTIRRDTTKVTALLLEKGADIHAANLNQQTALHFVSFGGELQTVALLCEHGGSILAEDKRGWLPADIALGANAVDIEEFLLSQDSIQDKSVVDISQNLSESAIDILLRATFVESSGQLNLFRDALTTLYSNPDFQPIIDLAAIHAMGTRRQHKALRFFLAKGKGVSSVTAKGKKSVYYPDSHAIVVSTAHTREAFISAVALELTYHASQFVFRNNLLPYPAGDSLSEKMYKAAIDQDARESCLALGIEEKEIQRLTVASGHILGKSVQKYPMYNAGVAQAIALFGVHQVRKICPGLANYFSQQFVPFCHKARDSYPLTKFLLPASQEAPAKESFTALFPVQKISTQAVNGTVIAELVYLMVLSKVGKPKTPDAPPTALQTSYVLDHEVQVQLSSSLVQLEKVLDSSLDIKDLPEAVLAEDLRDLIRALAELYTNGITRDVLAPNKKQVKQLIMQWQEGFCRFNPRPSKPNLFGKLAGYLPSSLFVKGETQPKVSVQVSENVSLSGMLEEIKQSIPEQQETAAVDETKTKATEKKEELA